MRPMPIIRSRTGCFTCRRRKKKCNEEKPVCSGCRRNKLDCNWPPDVASSSANSGPAQPAKREVAASPSKQQQQQPHHGHQQLHQNTAQRSLPQHPTHQPQHPHPQRPTQHPLPHPHPPQYDDKPKHHALQHRHQPSSSLAPDPDLSDLDVPDQSSIVVAGPPRTAPSPLTRPRDDSSTPGPASEDTDMAEADEQSLHPSPSPSSSHSSSGSADSSLAPRLAFDYDQDLDGMALAVTAPPALPLPEAAASPFAGPSGVMAPMSLMPDHSHQSYELLSYYLSRTANSMGNGSTDVNPFIAKLIPLGFSNPLVLQLLLAQSAAHRQAADVAVRPANQIAQRYYTDSLRMFRNVVSEYVSGREENTLVLTVGSLILCLTEVARGDIHGTVFDHLTASKSLLTGLLTRPKSEQFDDLPDFLVEYYMHISASSMISIDPHYSSQPLLISPDIEQLARNLVERKYVGQLCGCWLELLVLIPQVFHLGQSMMAVTDGEPAPPSPDNIVTFGLLQAQAMAFFPDASVTPYSRLAGLVFKQAVLLYLWTILGTPQQHAENTSHKAIMDAAVSDAVALMSQLPATVRVNTSLCWPLAVIGCCTADPEIQQILRVRLQTMVDTIGLGNMRETLVLLEHVWRLPLEEISPWTLCKAMRDHQIWISFA